MSIIGVPIIAGASSTKLDSTAIAPAYSALSTYAVGDIVTNSGAVYKCKMPITTPEEWNNAKWDVVTIESQIDDKVDKVSGKQLSDYTTAEKNKLANIEAGANKTIVDTDMSSTSTNPVQNKVVSREINGLKSTANWFNSIPGTTQTVNFDSNGKPTSVVHTSGNDIIRTDSFVWSTDSVTETRTLADGRYIVLTTNLTTLVTTISDIQEGA